MAARLCRPHTETTLAEPAARFGLTRADSVPNLTRRIEARRPASLLLAEEPEPILRRMANATGPQAPPTFR